MSGARTQSRPERPPLTEGTREAMRRVMARYTRARSALLPMLYLVQAEHGYVSDRGVAEIAGILGLTKAEVMAVATFYTMFKREPLGRWLVSVCTQPSCALAGGAAIKDALEAELGIGCGGTTPDGAISLEDVECLCACDGAPVVQVNYENHERLGVEGALDLVRRLRSGERPPPTRGDPLDSREAHRLLSGIEGARERYLRDRAPAAEKGAP